ncbi:MAG: AAA family ATPase [Clostridia bacterium]|nr:AAA family ATPase [Clostridia bacterium]
MNFNTFINPRYRALDFNLTQEILSEKFTLKDFPNGKNLALWVGARGSGKSTLLANLYEYGTIDLPYIDSSMFAKKRFSHLKDPAQATLWANQAVNTVCESLIKCGKSFCLETSFDDCSALDIVKDAKKHGYRFVFFYVETSDAQLNKKRLKAREMQGGEVAQEEEIEKSVASIRENVIKLIEHCDAMYMFDNSKELTQTNERLRSEEKENVGGALWL